MSLITVIGSRAGANYSQNQYLINYGNNNVDYQNQRFSLPYDGYIKYITVKVQGVPNYELTYNLINNTTATTYTDVVTIPASQGWASATFSPTDIPFSTNDLLSFQNHAASTGQFSNTSVIFWIEIPSLSSNLISINGSLIGNTSTKPETTFMNGNEPYSFGDSNKFRSTFAAVTIDNAIALPVACHLIAGTFCIHNSLSAGASLNVLKNDVFSGAGFLLPSGDMAVSIYPNIAYAAGDIYNLRCVSNNGSLTSSTVTAIFSVD